MSLDGPYSLLLMTILPNLWALVFCHRCGGYDLLCVPNYSNDIPETFETFCTTLNFVVFLFDGSWSRFRGLKRV